MTSCEGALAVDAARGPVVLDRAPALLGESQPFSTLRRENRNATRGRPWERRENVVMHPECGHEFVFHAHSQCQLMQQQQGKKNKKKVLGPAGIMQTLTNE